MEIKTYVTFSENEIVEALQERYSEMLRDMQVYPDPSIRAGEVRITFIRTGSR